MKFYYLNRLFVNRVFWYLFTRYFTYFLQFVSSILIAVKLGAYYWGIWNFILLLINYFQIFNLGIENAANILLVQNKDNLQRFKNLLKSSLLCVVFVQLLFLLVGFSYYLFDWDLGKYKLGVYFYYICLIGILIRINQLCMTVYRIRNRLFEMAFYQSVIPVCLFFALFFASGEKLLLLFLNIYWIGYVVAFFIFLLHRQIVWDGQVCINDIKLILKKGCNLFIYNVCFYLIIISTRSIVSSFYTVEEFGYFAFAYTLAHAILLLLESFNYVIFPKVIKRFSNSNKSILLATIEKLRVNYVSMSHGLIYIAIALFPYFLLLVTEYANTLPALNMVALSVLMYTNSFGYNSFLMAQGNEKRLAIISISCLLVNVLIALILVWLQVDYYIIVLATLCAYFLYSYWCTYYGHKLLNTSSSIKYVLKDCMPLELFLPYVVAIAVSSISLLRYFSFLPLVIYIFFNRNNIREIINTIKQVILNPKVINV